MPTDSPYPRSHLRLITNRPYDWATDPDLVDDEPPVDPRVVWDALAEAGALEDAIEREAAFVEWTEIVGPEVHTYPYNVESWDDAYDASRHEAQAGEEVEP